MKHLQLTGLIHFYKFAVFWAESSWLQITSAFSRPPLTIIRQQSSPLMLLNGQKMVTLCKMFLATFSDCWDNERLYFLFFLMFCFLGAVEAVISYSSSLQVEKHRCIKQEKKGQKGAAIESLSAVWEKQIISALFHARLHIVSTSAL